LKNSTFVKKKIKKPSYLKKPEKNQKNTKKTATLSFLNTWAIFAIPARRV
jgi:hypothetical protein